MNSHDKILLGLSCHARSKCSECPYEDQPECSSKLAADAEKMCKPAKRIGIAVVEHQVSTNLRYCEYDGPDDGFGERSVCRYRVTRGKTGKRGEAIRQIPRCTLFEEWLEKEGFSTKRCLACRIACREVER